MSGVETIHPDKGVELFLCELGVHEDHRRQGIAGALATYRSAGNSPPEPSVVLERSLTPRPDADRA